MQGHFFAAADDLIPVFERAEKKESFSYTVAGLFDSPELVTVRTGAALPTLRQPAPHREAVGCPWYLVMPPDLSVQVREVTQRAGGMKYAVDQLINPDSIVVSHGGVYDPNILLYGKIGTSTDSKIAISLFRLFANAIAKHFERIRSFWVGPEARQLRKNGWRLTIGANSPRENDLADEPV